MTAPPPWRCQPCGGHGITYTGIATPIRKGFARHNQVPARLFSANSEGACPECKGLGIVSTDLAFMEDQETVCETCQGRRFMPEVLEYRVDGLSRPWGTTEQRLTLTSGFHK